MLKEFIEQLSEVFTKRERVVPVLLPFKASKRIEYYWDPALKTVESIRVDRDDSRHQFLSIGSIELRFVGVLSNERLN